MKIQIKSIYGNLILEGDFSCLAEAVKSALAAKANLRSADLSSADLSSANLSSADLRSADLRSANLSSANLRSANLRSAKNSELAIAMTRILPEGDLIGWKKGADGAIVKLLVPTEAKRSSAFGRKCRAEFVRVLEIFRDGKPSDQETFGHYDNATKYNVGKETRCDKWCDDFTQECAGGIHFFITRLEAETYAL